MRGKIRWKSYMRHVIFVFVLLLLVQWARASVRNQIDCDFTNPATTLKVQPTCKDAGPIATTLRIGLARGEYEDVQLVLTARGRDLKSVSISTSDLTAADGAVIPSSRVVVTPLGFVDCKPPPSPRAPLTGQIPDVLLPNRPMDIAQGRRQPWYITVHALPGDKPGDYLGKVNVSIDGAAAQVLPLVVHIYKLTIPLRSHLVTAFVAGNFKNYQKFPGDHDEYMNAAMNCAKVMLSYRVSPCFFWPPPKHHDGSYDFSDYDRLLSTTIPLGLTAFNIGADGDPSAYQWVGAARKRFQTRGWWDLEYCYGSDEASGDAVKTLPDRYKALIDAAPDIRILQTGWNPAPPIKDLVKIWCPILHNINLDALHDAQKKGDQFWSYVCSDPKPPYPTLWVDCPGIDSRILGWMAFKEGMQGFLYWDVDFWNTNPPPFEKYDKANFSNWNPRSFAEYNGDGYLLYPGKNDSVIGSVRLAGVRDGFQDYDVFVEARALTAKGGPTADKLKSLLTFDAPIINTLIDFTDDGNVLIARREQILKTADELLN